MKLHEAHAALDEPAGQQAVIRKAWRARLSTVRFEDVARLAVNVENITDPALKAQFAKLRERIKEGVPLARAMKTVEANRTA